MDFPASANAPAGAPAGFQARVRHQLHHDALDAAYRMLTDRGWAAVTMTAIAAEVGVSRQTLYKEFASKDQIGQALLSREAERFLDGVARHLAPHDDPIAAIEATVRYGLTEGSANPLLRAVLSGDHGGDTLLALVTANSQTLITLAAQVLHEHITTRGPHLDDEDVTATADALVRLTASHLLQPLDSIDTTVARLTRLARRNLVPHTEPDHPG